MKKSLYIITGVSILALANGLTSNPQLLLSSVADLDTTAYETDTEITQFYAEKAAEFATSAEAYEKDASDFVATAEAYMAIFEKEPEPAEPEPAEPEPTYSCTDMSITSTDLPLAADATQVEDINLTVSTTADGETWEDKLYVTVSTGQGVISSETSMGSNDYLTISGTSNTLNYTYNNGAVGDIITASTTDCSAEIEITQIAKNEDDTDADSDGLTYIQELALSTDPTNSDSDGDGLTDGEEVLTYLTNPLTEDSDSDGADDYWELYYGLDPLTDDSSADTDGDGYTNLEEYANKTDPTVTDEDSTECSTGYTYDTSSSSCVADAADDEDSTECATGYTYDTSSSSCVADAADDDAATDEVLSSDSYSCTDSFADTEAHWAQDLICRLYQIGVVKGRSSTLFEPDDYVTRAEWIKILILSAGYDESEASSMTESFEDVTSTDWYYPYMVIAESLDVARSRDGDYFNPNIPITRGDAVLYAVRMAGETLYGWGEDDIPFSDLTTSDYFAYAVLIANQTIVDVPDEGETPVIEGYDDGTFKPDAYITRAEAVTVALRATLAWFK